MTVAGALQTWFARVGAEWQATTPEDVVMWAERYGDDVRAAWTECRRAHYLVALASAYGAPVRPFLACAALVAEESLTYLADAPRGLGDVSRMGRRAMHMIDSDTAPLDDVRELRAEAERVERRASQVMAALRPATRDARALRRRAWSAIAAHVRAPAGVLLERLPPGAVDARRQAVADRAEELLEDCLALPEVQQLHAHVTAAETRGITALIQRSHAAVAMGIASWHLARSTQPSIGPLRTKPGSAWDDDVVDPDCTEIHRARCQAAVAFGAATEAFGDRHLSLPAVHQAWAFWAVEAALSKVVEGKRDTGKEPPNADLVLEAMRQESADGKAAVLADLLRADSAAIWPDGVPWERGSRGVGARGGGEVAGPGRRGHLRLVHGGAGRRGT